MDKRAWIWVAVISVVVLLTCCGSAAMFIASKGREAMEAIQEISEYAGYSAEISEANGFSAALDGGGTFSLTEIGIVDGKNIRRWTKTDGWKTVPAKNVKVPFEFEFGYTIGKVDGRTATEPRVRSELGAMKMLPTGEFWLDINYLESEWNSIEYADAEYVVEGSWEPGGKATGRLKSYSGFRVGKAKDLAKRPDIWPIYEDIDVAWLKGETAQGVIYQVSEWDMVWEDIAADLVLKSGEKVRVNPWTFYDGSGEVWWIWPYEGDLGDIVRMDYLVRPAHDVEILGLDLPSR